MTHHLRRLFVAVVLVAALLVSGSSALIFRTPAQRDAWRRWNAQLVLQQWFDAVYWFPIARCETGANWQMHGSRYSTGLGIMNAAVRENASPDDAALLLSGRAPISLQIELAKRIERRFGVHAWACGRQLYP